MRRRSINCTISASDVSGATEITSCDISCSQVRPWVRTYSLAVRPGPNRKSSQGQCRRSVAISLRRNRSPSVRMPSTLPPASTTGNPLILLLSISRIASRIGVLRATVTTLRVMTSAAFICVSVAWVCQRRRLQAPFPAALTSGGRPRRERRHPAIDGLRATRERRRPLSRHRTARLQPQPRRERPPYRRRRRRCAAVRRE